MKTLLNKFRIRSALDENRPLSPGLQREVDRSPELRCWIQSNRGLDHLLRKSVPMPPPPETLQADILQALHRESQLPTRPHLPRLAWLPIPAAALVLLIAWALLDPTGDPAVSDTSPLDSTGAAIELSGRLAHSAPDVLLAPMADELERLNRDLDSTAKFLLANLP
jgi:hypothetical protein